MQNKNIYKKVIYRDIGYLLLRKHIQGVILMIETIIIHSPDENKFFLMSGIDKVGHLGYTLKDDILTIHTTFVQPDFRHGFAGRRLVDTCVEFARESKYKISSDCSYVDRLFEKYDQYNDVKVD
jgi:predicted GNAT family acetyltransferase